ncbi:uncharacterized protein CcaverHIS019_0302930 [Cutaneotrichosporon cavernicola]|uniref:Phytochrome n=1 Tax=Cutaneotrichosporon cavernicola TaxID=279322 RepID=A0AA48IGM4_9TREE|nr:uncharacterized protein CcaverHIS019_0302930 [Cutaneotrichosporon cavernicola]BEI90223.1 hypothetical protein CcaverHIS019_0302930 [Cutaneotrichosporon cavernicola]BEI98002.1 hypothetical protein CcaverHIS631_0303010 [Cutaneotrichosporon cavernicola]BEJ05778.1 hypothetical protein CcaverHIS641_0303000 [Cutaneotrichosporon cavernicola]
MVSDIENDGKSIPDAMMAMLENTSCDTGSSPKSTAMLNHRSPMIISEKSERELPLQGRTTLESDDAGVTNLVNDFSGIIRLGDAPQSETTVGGLSTILRPATAKATSVAAGMPRHRDGDADIGRLLHTGTQTSSGSMSAQTRDSVPNFVNDQAQTSTSQTRTRRCSLPGEDGATMSSDEGVTEGPFTTSRFNHVTTEDGHYVVVGREGTLQRCEDEPIRMPGAVQGFGVLILLEEDYDTGDMTVRQVSENSTELLGLSPQYLFGLPCFSDVLTDDQDDALRDIIESLPYSDGQVSEPASGYEVPQVFRLSGYGEPGSDDTRVEEMPGLIPSHRREWTCWAAARRPKMDSWIKYDDRGEQLPVPNLVMLELELERDNYNPLTQPLDYFAEEDMQMPESAESVISRETGLYDRGFFASRVRHSSSGSACDTLPERMELSSNNPSLEVLSNSTRTRSTGVCGVLAPASFADTPVTLPSNASPSELSSGNTLPTTAQVFPGAADSSNPRRRKRYGLKGLEEYPPVERVLDSTTNYAKPLRAAPGIASHKDTRNSRGPRGRGSRPRRKRRTSAASSADALDVVAVLNQINEQLGGAQDLDSFLKIAVGLVKDLCHFSRVVVYQFDEEYNGKVVTELVDWGTTTDLWKGLMFPAADIPPQARELYRINKVRFLYDRSQMTARLVLRDKSDLEHPLDMTHCFLRAMSPIHLKYLANMEVRSSMSISIMAFGKLWGLIACHSYGNHGMRVSFPVRQMLCIFSDVMSRNVERLWYAQKLKTRQIINTTGFAGMASFGGKSSQRGGSSDGPFDSPSSQGYLVSNADELLDIFDADSGMLVINDGCKLLGECDKPHAMLAIAEYLGIAKFGEIIASNYLTHDFPDLILPRAADTIAGLLYVPLTNEPGKDFLVLLRKGQVDEVKWAGRPFINEDVENKAVLEPRSSFKLWVQKVTGRSRVWTNDQLDSAHDLSLMYGKFIRVWREHQNAMMSNQLTAILLSNTSHAVRTPLSQIINTLELALAGNLDSDTRNMLENSHNASRALLFHVHDLLDLTRIETGNETAFNDPFDIKQTIGNTVRLYQTETQRRGIQFVVTMADDLPQMVIGDSRKIKTVVSNLVANAVKYTREGSIEVTCGLEPKGQPTPDSVSIEITVSDTGCGIAPEKLEAMFVTLEGAEDRADGGSVGLGLAVVGRIVEQLHGQLRAESRVGKGTRFYFTCTMGVNADFQPNGSGSGGLLLEHANPPKVHPSSKRPSVSVATASLDHTKDRPDRAAASTTVPAVEAVRTPPLRSKIGPKGGPQLRILVVEDDIINSQILQKRLKMDNHIVHVVENGQEAVDTIAADWDFDAVIMDIQMPILDGYGAAAAIRELETKNPASGIEPVHIDGRLPIFALSASLYEEDRVNLGTHFDGWLLKPLQFNRLRALLAALIDSEKRVQEIYRPGEWERGGYFRDGWKV